MISVKHTVLIADDDRDIVHLISDSLLYEQFKVVTAYSGTEALEKMHSEKIDFIILDIMMPETDGLDVCRAIRKNYTTPILILSARDREMDKIIGLEIGADDYMTKPFSVRELISRVKAHFRKYDRLKTEWVEKKGSTNTTHGILAINRETYTVHYHGQPIDLSTREFQILVYLADRPERVLSREQIYAYIWGDEFGDLNTVTVHIKNIRKKFGTDFHSIKTVWGVGYKFVNEDESHEA